MLGAFIATAKSKEINDLYTPHRQESYEVL